MAAALPCRTYISEKRVEKLRDGSLNELVDCPTYSTMPYIKEKHISISAERSLSTFAERLAFLKKPRTANLL